MLDYHGKKKLVTKTKKKKKRNEINTIIGLCVLLDGDSLH
jgi:hypothetical protein